MKQNNKLPEELKGTNMNTNKTTLDFNEIFSIVNMVIFMIAYAMCIVNPTVSNLAVLMVTGLAHATSDIADAIRCRK